MSRDEGESPGGEPLLRARNLAKVYQQRGEPVHALRDASVTVAPGELVALEGRSGSGKTTFLHLAAGLDTPDEGHVELLGTDLAAAGTRDRLALRADGLGFVFQEPGLVPELTLLENAAMAARIRGVGGADARDRAAERLAAVGLEGLGARFPAEVSGGEAQRASLARALAKDPVLLVGDEPTAELDRESAEAVADVIRRYVDAGGAALVATHDEVLAGAAHRRVRLRDGRIVDGAPP